MTGFEFIGLADVAKPRDATHCQFCRRPMKSGDFCMHSSSPINKRAPFKYRSRVAHWDCYERDVEAALKKRGSKRVRVARKGTAT